jgi:hypothetical protein
MGLDMFAFSVAKNDSNEDFAIADGLNRDEIAYWRKHHDLHGWMEKLYRAKGGDADSFNCIPVRLTLEDLKALEQDLMDSALPETTGFFFGNNPPDEDSLREDLVFIAKARAEIAMGREVYYDSWW